MLCPFKFNKAEIIRADSGCEKKLCAFFIVDKEEEVIHGVNLFFKVDGHCCIKDLFNTKYR